MSVRLGVERCFLREPGGRYTFWTMGSGNIDNRLAQGWTIVEHERNHLTRELVPVNGKEFDPETANEETRATIGLHPVKTETENEPNSTPERNHAQEHDNRPKRPRIKR